MRGEEQPIDQDLWHRSGASDRGCGIDRAPWRLWPMVFRTEVRRADGRAGLNATCPTTLPLIGIRSSTPPSFVLPSPSPPVRRGGRGKGLRFLLPLPSIGKQPGAMLVHRGPTCCIRGGCQRLRV